MAIHIAEMYAALVAQRRQVFAALRDAPPAGLSEPGLPQGSILDTLTHIAYVEHRQLTHVLRRGPDRSPADWAREFLPGGASLDAAEAAATAVAALMRDYIRLEKPYDLVLPRKNLGPAGGTPEQVLWGILMHEMGHLGEISAACHRLNLPCPELTPVDHLRRNPELGRWWMAEQY